MEILTPTILRAPDNPELIGGCVPRSVQVKEEKNMQERGSGWACQGERYGKQRQRDSVLSGKGVTFLPCLRNSGNLSGTRDVT